MKSIAAQDAEAIRRVMKINGINPKGLVRVINHDYETIIEVDARGNRELIEDCVIIAETSNVNRYYSIEIL